MLRLLKNPHKENPSITHYELISYNLDADAVCLRWADENGPLAVDGNIVSIVEIPFASNIPSEATNKSVELTDTRFVFSYEVDSEADGNYRLLSTLDNELDDLIG